MKKTILHIIYNLGPGGAERMLVSVVAELKEYRNIIVTLEDVNHFKEELQCDDYVCLNMRSPQLFPLAAIKLRKIIRQYKPDIVHSHLFWPTLIARLGTPKKIPLVTTIHAFVATSIEYEKKHIKWLDQFSYHFRKSVIIAVAKGALKEYFSFLKLKPFKAYALYTFVDTRIFNDKNTVPSQHGSTFRLICIGTLKEQKNHQYLVNAFTQLRDENIELHIYGIGTLHAALEKTIQENNIHNVKLMGLVKNIQEVIQQYDLFVMSSKFEGFSLAVLEAMALQMPMLLSDIDSFKEQCEDTAEYFDLKNTADFVDHLKQLSSDKSRLCELGKNAKERVLTNFTLEHHMQGLRNIYTETLNNQ